MPSILMSILLTIASMLILSNVVTCRPTYKDRIPNGHNVPNPCTSNADWQGVGHWRMGGSGPLNPFGEALRDAGFSWTSTLCNADSDGDGQTNGEELGDPDCVWREGTQPAMTTGISHPGICQPVESANCRALQPSFSCSGDIGYDCPPIRESHVQHIDLRLPVTAVPEVRTTYFCTIFEVPNDIEYHAIAFEPIVDNPNVLHHMMLYGCGDSITSASEPQSCDMSNAECLSLVALWNVGADGICLREDLGMRFGKGHFKYLSLQTHWNNPEHVTDYTDSSGMKMYYTSQLREFDQEVIMTGQTDLTIPPLTRETSIEGTCPESCTRTMPHSVNVMYANLHMHYLGQSGKAELYRDGQLHTTIFDELESSYEVPIMHIFENPLVIMPGDVIKTTCRYNTLDDIRRRDETVYYGEGTEDEMCYTTLWYYPAIKGFDCVQHGDYVPCGESCNYDGLYDRLDTVILYLLRTGICNDTDSSASPGGCPDACFSYLRDMLEDNCFRNYISSIKDDPEAMNNIYIQYYMKVDEKCYSRFQGTSDASVGSAATMIWSITALLTFLLC